jgi:hypothetical protein
MHMEISNTFPDTRTHRSKMNKMGLLHTVHQTKLQTVDFAWTYAMGLKSFKLLDNV